MSVAPSVSAPGAAQSVAVPRSTTITKSEKALRDHMKVSRHWIRLNIWLTQRRAPRSGHSGQCLQDFGDSTFIVVNGVQPPAPGPVVIAPAPPAAPAPAMGPQQPAAFINAQMAAFGNRLATLNANFVAANANMAGFNNQLVGVNNRLAGYDAQFQAHDASWVAHDGLLQAHDTRLDGLNNRVEELQAELEKLREKRWRTIKLWSVAKILRLGIISNIYRFYEVRGVYGWR